MFVRGHVTDPIQAKALYDAYEIPYKEMKRSGEVRAKTSSRILDFYNDVEQMLRKFGAEWILDHIDVCEDIHGERVFVASPYGGHVDSNLKRHAERNSFEITETEFMPYEHTRAIVIRKNRI